MPADTIILIDRQKIQIENKNKIYNLILPETVVKDLEVIDIKSLLSLFRDFTQKNLIVLGVTIVVLSEDVCFWGNSYKEGFLSSLPFDYPIVITIGSQSIATNQDLYNAFVDAVDQNGGQVKSVSPLFISKEMVGKKDLDLSVAKFIISNENFYIKNSFSLGNNKIKVQNQVVTKSTKITKQTIVLISIFIFLAIILLIMVITNLHH